MREDFIDLGVYNQVGRALLRLIRKGIIVKIGNGLYAKTKLSSLTGEPMLIEPLPILAKEAMKRLGIKISPTTAELDYQASKSTQVSTGKLIGVKSWGNRKIDYKGASITMSVVRDKIIIEEVASIIGISPPFVGKIGLLSR